MNLSSALVPTDFYSDKVNMPYEPSIPSFLKYITNFIYPIGLL